MYDVRNYRVAFRSDLDFAFDSVPFPWRNNETVNLVAGKMIGGSGSLNGASWTSNCIGPKSLNICRFRQRDPDHNTAFC